MLYRVVLEVFDGLLKAHHVRVGALVLFLGVCQLLLQSLVLLSLRPQVLHHRIQLLLTEPFLVHLLQRCPLSVLNSLQKLDLLHELFILLSDLKQFVLKISDCAVALDNSLALFR